MVFTSTTTAAATAATATVRSFGSAMGCRRVAVSVASGLPLPRCRRSVSGDTFSASPSSTSSSLSSCRHDTSGASTSSPRREGLSPCGSTRRGLRRACRAGDQMPGPLDGLANDNTAKAAMAAKEKTKAKAADGEEGEKGAGEELLEVENVPPMQFLWGSVAFYALMGVGSQVAASALGVHPDVFDAMRTCNLDAASLWTLPLLASLAFAITQADEFEFLSEVRDIFKVGVLPSLAPLGLPGILALSLGAGVGEEALFRGFLMPFADGQLARLGAPEEAASVGVLLSTSVFFGALHAITPAYAIWAG